MPSIRIFPIHISTRIQSGFVEIGQFCLAISLVLILSSSFMWFTNLKPRGEEDAFLQADIQKTSTYLIQQQVAGIYEKAEQFPVINLVNECESDINNIQLSQDKMVETEQTIAQIEQKIDKIYNSTKSINIFNNNNDLVKYTAVVQTIVQKTKVGINEQFYRQTKTIDILKKLTEVCKNTLLNDKKVAAAALEYDIKTSSEYQNLDPEWENSLLTWLETVQKIDSTTPQDPSILDEYKKLFRLNQKSSETQLLQKANIEANIQLKNLEENQLKLKKSLNLKYPEITLLSK